MLNKNKCGFFLLSKDHLEPRILNKKANMINVGFPCQFTVKCG